MLLTVGALSSAISVRLWRMLWPVSISRLATGASMVEACLAGAYLGHRVVPSPPCPWRALYRSVQPPLPTAHSRSPVTDCNCTVPGNSRIVSMSFFDRSRDLSQDITHAFNLPSATVGFATLERICSRRTRCGLGGLAEVTGTSEEEDKQPGPVGRSAGRYSTAGGQPHQLHMLVDYCHNFVPKPASGWDVCTGCKRIP